MTAKENKEKRAMRHILYGMVLSYFVLFPNLNTGLTLLCVGGSVYAYTVAFQNLR